MRDDTYCTETVTLSGNLLDILSLSHTQYTHTHTIYTMERERKRRKRNESCLSFVLFGSTGDLSRKKLFPALSNLIERNDLDTTGLRYFVSVDAR